MKWQDSGAPGLDGMTAATSISASTEFLILKVSLMGSG
jgi:hypothetical protein